MLDFNDIGMLEIFVIVIAFKIGEFISKIIINLFKPKKPKKPTIPQPQGGRGRT